jgi:hypothetical protein
MSTFQKPYSCVINAAKFKLNTLNGREYLTAPVVMAKVTVMNKILYKEDELKRSVVGWNNRPVTVSHPANEDGSFLSANSPEVLEKYQVGFVFNTRMDKGKLKAEIWLDKDLLANHKDLANKIDAGEMIEVSTGLFLDLEEKEGVFNSKEYVGIGHSYLPDHLALLPNEIGACSIEDGAGFPRVNTSLEVNEMLPNDKSEAVYNAFRKEMAARDEAMKDKDGFIPYTNRDMWIDTIHETFLIARKYSDGMMKLSYSMNENTGTVSFGNAIPVIRTVEYKEIKMENETTPAVNAEAAPAPVVEAPAPAVNVETPAVVAPVEAPAPVVNEDEEAMRALFDNAKKEAISKVMANKHNTFTEAELQGMKFNQLQKISQLATVEQVIAPAVNAEVVPAGATVVNRLGLGGPGGVVTGSPVKIKPL